jgi:translocation and assembly module TamB
MRGAGKAVSWLGATLGALALFVLAAFGMLQTPVGKAWLATKIARVISSPDFTIAIEGLGGAVPFDMAVARIDIGDRDGTYLIIRDVTLNVTLISLLAGRLHIRSLRIGEIDMARSSTAPSTTPLVDYIRVPHLPVGVVLDRLSIERVALEPPVLGEGVVATIAGSGELAGNRARVVVDLHRSDGSAGNFLLATELVGDPPVLSVHLDGAEPTGVVVDRLLGRADRLPLVFGVNGTGPLDDWHGALSVAAGSLAHLGANLTLAVAAETVFGMSGTAALAPLLPPEFASLAGDQVGFSAHATFGDRIVVDPLSVETAAGSLTGNAAFTGATDTLAANLRADIPQLARLAALLGQPITGSAILTATITGSKRSPAVELKLSGSEIRFATSGAEHIGIDARATATGALDSPKAHVELTAKGRLEGLIAPEGVALPPALGRDIDWSLAATGARDGSSLDVTSLTAEGPGASLEGSGQLNENGAIQGLLRLSVADLRPFSGLAAHPLAGAIELETTAARDGTAGFNAQIAGSATELKTGIPVADALLGSSTAVTGSLRRDDAGILFLDRLTVTGGTAALSGGGRFDPASNGLTGTLALDLPHLKPLSAAFGTEIAGAVSAHVNFEGSLDRLHLSANLDGSDIMTAGAKLDRLRLAAQVPNLSEPSATLDGGFRAYGLDGTLAFAAVSTGGSELVFPRFRIAAADSAIEGSLRVDLDSALVRGSIAGRVPDLGRWSRLAGTPLGGNLEFSAGLDARGGQMLDLAATGTRLTAGAGSARLAAGRLVATARFADILGKPSGSGRVALTSASYGAGEFAIANLTVDAPRPGRFVFQADSNGQPITVALAGDGQLEPGRLDLRLIRLAGTLGRDRLFLERPLTLSKRGGDLAFAGLALNFGTGRITGSGGVRGDAVSLALNAANLPIASAGRLIGYRYARGNLNVATTIGGTLRAPRGHVSLDARDLTLAASKHSRLTSLGLALDGTWNGRNLDLKGQVTGLKGDQIAFGGSVPVLLTPAPLGVSVPPDGRLALQLQGAGQLEHLADLLPLGEDRVTGRFAADVAVGGTVASPAANGRLKLSDTRYENFATGALLTNMQADLIGDRDRFTLTSFSASDNASGTLKAQGNVVLRGSAGPTAELTAELANFRVAARDEAVATATGKVSIAGPLTAPKVTAPLTLNRADINLPDTLPPNVVVLKVVKTNGKAGEPSAPPATQSPALAVALDITLDMPGNIFVRGHGLESEWRGRLTITGTSTAPAISGSLEQIRGSVDFLGKTFTLTRGTITFDGSAKLDPVLDIVAEASAADITAQVIIGGLASAPTVTLSSTPPVPQDEILARVLFNRGVGQITAGEGLQLAAAAGTLAGGGPGVLDKLRGGLGLDWFRLGSGPSGPASSTLNPRAARGGAASGSALSAGKYIAPGVSVGVSQGLSPPTSKVTVEIELRRHLTVQGEAGQSGSTGIGVNYNYDY